MDDTLHASHGRKLMTTTKDKEILELIMLASTHKPRVDGVNYKRMIVFLIRYRIHHAFGSCPA